jgi:hypothetical protein
MHAARQKRYRERKKIVTDHGSKVRGENCNIESNSHKELDDNQSTNLTETDKTTPSSDDSPERKKNEAALEILSDEPTGLQPCMGCGRPCGPRTRTDRFALSTGRGAKSETDPWLLQ